jgi:hypothetical protein
VQEIPFSCEDADNKVAFDSATCQNAKCEFVNSTKMDETLFIGIIAGAAGVFVLIVALMYCFCCRTA